MTSYSPTKMSSKENLAGTENNMIVGTENNTIAVTATTAETDTVVLHQFPRNQFGPSLSPFALKLETYIRLAKVTYTNDFSKPQSSKGKCPWITYKNQNIADSAMCVEFLKTTTGRDINAHLSPVDKAISRAFQKLIEEELNWVLALWRWSYDKEESTAKSLQAGKIKEFLTQKIVRSTLKKSATGHGIGRHTQAEVMKIGEDDIRAVGEFLGTKTYFMGEEASDVDATVFGLFAQLMYTSPTCPLTAFVRENYQNIVEYCARIKDEVWPDWDEICKAQVKPEKKAVKHTLSIEPAAAITNGNGTDHHDVGKTNGVASNHVDATTIVTVQQTEHFIPTAYGDVLVQEIESTKMVNGGGHHHVTENGHVGNGDHVNKIAMNSDHYATTNGFHNDTDNTVVSHTDTNSHVDSGHSPVDTNYSSGDAGSIIVGTN